MKLKRNRKAMNALEEAVYEAVCDNGPITIGRLCSMFNMVKSDMMYMLADLPVVIDGDIVYQDTGEIAYQENEEDDDDTDD